MTFREAVDVLGIPQKEVAHAFGLEVQTIRQMLVPPGKPSHRRPPAGWEAVVAGLADGRAQALSQLAEHLRSPGT